MENESKTVQLVIYLKDSNGNNLEAGTSCGSWVEKYGIKAGIVMEKCLGLTDQKVYLSDTEVNFKYKVIEV